MVRPSSRGIPDITDLRYVIKLDDVGPLFCESVNVVVGGHQVADQLRVGYQLSTLIDSTRACKICYGTEGSSGAFL